MLQCSHCTKEFKYESEKKRHEQSHVPQFECKVCSKKFSFMSALRRHEKQHERKGAAQCSKCGGCFRDETLLKRHMQYAHKGTFTCSECSSQFNSEAALNTHMKTHRPEAERQFRCPHPGCAKSFNFSHHLKHHQLTHTQDKQHFCSACGKGFIQSYHLKMHLKTHEPEAWLACPFESCSKKFSNEYARKRHEATHKKINLNRIKFYVRRDTVNNHGQDDPGRDGTLRQRRGDVNKNSRSGASSDSSANCDSPTPVPVLMATLCVDCGELVTDQDLAIHTGLHKEQTEPEDLSVTSLGISIKEISDKMEANQENGSECDSAVRESSSDNGNDEIMEVSEPCKCKRLLHDDTDTDSQNFECFCEKVTRNVDDFYESNTDNDVNDLQVIKLTDEFKDDDYSNHECNKCDRCECANICSDEDKTKLCQFNMAPDIPIECTDGILKIKDTFDTDIPLVKDINVGITNNDSKEISQDKSYTEPIESKLGFRDVKCAQFNTCEDVLGKCIMSETGAISDECLCAKMSADDQQMITREIEELTPCPKKSTWFNIKYKVRL